MPKFMRGNDDAGETTSVLHDRHTVHLFQPLVDDTRPSHISKTSSSSVAVAPLGLSSAHV